MADFTMSPEIKKLRADVRAFMDEFVYPNEDVIEDGGGDRGAGARALLPWHRHQLAGDRRALERRAAGAADDAHA